MITKFNTVDLTKAMTARAEASGELTLLSVLDDDGHWRPFIYFDDKLEAFQARMALSRCLTGADMEKDGFVANINNKNNS